MNKEINNITEEEIKNIKEELKKTSLKINMYAIKDIKQNRFASPFFAPNDQMAIRMLYGAVNIEEKGKSMIADYAIDYDLYKLGYYDEKSGELTKDNKYILNAGELKNKDYKEIFK